MRGATPMWRNGRRNGLKIRSREKRGMGSNPIIGTSENAIFIGKIVTFCDFLGCERSRTKTHGNTVYLTSIRQVTWQGFPLVPLKLEWESLDDQPLLEN
jgi:hypothetical protein